MAEPISLTLPPCLPECSLSAAFQDSETNEPIAPAFYPGQTIPTVLTFNLNRYASLPFSLNASLGMSLVGTLHLPCGPPRTIICVSVSLAEGLELWARDAQQAYANRSPRHSAVDVTTALPGGTYSLPLTVQVPSTPRLPPSFNISGAAFAVTYALAVTLACDDPLRPGSRVTLAEASRPFEMMPDTLPTRAPRYTETSFSVRTAASRRLGSHSRWTVKPTLPTTAFSPTSHLPLSLRLSPPSDLDEAYQVLVRIALVRREHSTPADASPRDPLAQSGHVHEVDVVSTMAWFEVDGESIDIQTVLPIMPVSGLPWLHGFSTTLNVGPASPDTDGQSISVSSTFHIASTLAFLPRVAGQTTLNDLMPGVLPPMGVFTSPLPGSTIDMASLKRHFPGTVRTLPLPVVIGSVSEPRLAMQTYRWSDLHLDNSGASEVSRVLSGETTTCEDGWISPPPSYQAALEVVPYEY